MNSDKVDWVFGCKSRFLKYKWETNCKGKQIAKGKTNKWLEPNTTKLKATTKT